MLQLFTDVAIGPVSSKLSLLPCRMHMVAVPNAPVQLCHCALALYSADLVEKWHLLNLKRMSAIKHIVPAGRFADFDTTFHSPAFFHSCFDSPTFCSACQMTFLHQDFIGMLKHLLECAYTRVEGDAQQAIAQRGRYSKD